MPRGSPALATKPSPIQPRDRGTPALGRVRRADQRINSPGDKITAEVPKWGQGRLDAGPVPAELRRQLWPWHGHLRLQWDVLAQSDSGVGWETAHRIGGVQIPTGTGQWVTPQQPPWERRSLFLQLCGGTPGTSFTMAPQGTPPLRWDPGDLSFAMAPSGPQISYEQSWGRAFPSACWDFTSRIQAPAQLCPSGAERSPKRTQPFVAPLVPQGEAAQPERWFAMSFAEPANSSA